MRFGSLKPGFSVLIGSITFLALAIGMGLFFSPRGGAKASPAPAVNLLIISIDSLRADHLGCYGYPRKTSPKIDAFSKKAVVFDHAYSTSSWTTPSMASLFTSLYPQDHHIRVEEDVLDEDFLTLAEHLQSYRYVSTAFISQTLLLQDRGFAQGFDRYDVSVVSHRDTTQTDTSKEITDLAIEALRSRGPDPFFFWVHYFDPHFDYHIHQDHYFGPRPVDWYDSEIAFTDFHIGRLLHELEASGLLTNTVVVLLADHGEEFLDHGGELHGQSIFDELVRIPLIVYVPGGQPVRNADRISMIDLAPTLLSLINVPVPEAFQGTIFPYGSEGFFKVPNRNMFFETHNRGQWWGMRFGRWKLVMNCERQAWSLFDTNYDPFEQADVKEKFSTTFETMRDSVENFFAGNTGQAKKNPFSQEQIDYLKSIGYL